MEEEILYIALVLEVKSNETLRESTVSLVPFENYKTYCHHMTLAFNDGNLPESIVQWATSHDGEGYTITATHFGFNEKACAVMIDDDKIPCRNRIKHVTVATNAETDGRPNDSNTITKWTRLEHPIVLCGTVRTFYKKKRL